MMKLHDEVIMDFIPQTYTKEITIDSLFAFVYEVRYRSHPRLPSTRAVDYLLCGLARQKSFE
jgi:hypothetical protein